MIIGGDQPIVMQSMLTCDTMDTAECVKQTLELVAVGCQIVRITAPTVKDAANLKHILGELRARRCLVPIVADIHFHYKRAIEAAEAGAATDAGAATGTACLRHAFRPRSGAAGRARCRGRAPSSSCRS